MQPKVLLIYPFTSAHLGLFDDLLKREDVFLFESGLKPVGKLGAFFRRIHFSRKLNRIITLPLKKIWYRQLPIKQFKSSLRTVIIVDGALNDLPESYMFQLKKKYPDIQFYVYLINAIEAASPIIQKIKPYILNFYWDGVFTFDQKDAEKYHLNYLGFCYYSKHAIEPASPMEVDNYDVYFIGGLKGGRDDEILNVYDYLFDHGIKCNFNLMTYGKLTQNNKEGLLYYPNGWRPYEDVLKGVQGGNCILEVLQHGQSGPSLRYYEAVCYNKKLLTNNPHIVDYPYYDNRFMRVFSSPEEIDIDWIKTNSLSEPVNYYYQDDFSPNTLVDFFLNR